MKWIKKLLGLKEKPIRITIDDLPKLKDIRKVRSDKGKKRKTMDKKHKLAIINGWRRKKHLKLRKNYYPKERKKR